MRKNNKVTFLVVLVFILITLVISTTHAYFTSKFTSKPQIITTKNLDLKVENNGKAINVENISPTKWNEDAITNISKYPNISLIPFTVTSDTKVNGEWYIYINSLIMLNNDNKYEGGELSDIKYRLYEKNNLVSNGEIDTKEEITKGNYSLTEYVNKKYNLYIYIEETEKKQDKFQNISFNVNLIGKANQTD